MSNLNTQPIHEVCQDDDVLQQSQINESFDVALDDPSMASCNIIW